MSRYRDQVAAALAAVTIRGPARYAWLGRASRRLPAALDADLDAPSRRSYLLACLREELYFSFYCHGTPVPARWGEPEPIAPDPWLVEAMSRANTGRGSWETGWTVERVEGGEVVVTNATLRARVPVGDCRAANGAVGPGAAVSVRLPSELPSLSPGFYTVLGDAAVEPAPVAGVAGDAPVAPAPVARVVGNARVEPAPPASVVRVYWNVGRAGAPDLVAALAGRLNGAGVPFRLKVADHPFRLDRCDAAVLYVDGDVFCALRPAFAELAAELRARLRPRVPAFTLELAPGVGLAEGGGESFGFLRCALLAEGVVRAHEQGITRAAARLRAVVDRFAEDGVDVDAPYRDPALAGRHVL